MLCARTSKREESNYIRYSFSQHSSINSSINFMKRKTSSSSNIENEEKEEKEKMKSSSKVKKEMKKKIKKEMILISKVKKSKQASKNARSKNCLASFDMIFVNVVVYNLLFKQKNVKLFVISLKNIDDQIQKNTGVIV